MAEEEPTGQRADWRVVPEDVAGTRPAGGPEASDPIPAAPRSRARNLLAHRPPRWAGILALLAVVGIVVWGPAAGIQTASTGPTTPGDDDVASADTTAQPTTPTTAPTTAPSQPVPAAAPPAAPQAPVPMGTAPLTGLPAPLPNLQRPALVSKIDGSLPAMPQLGLERADLVIEVKVEWGSRYLGVWHSRDAEVIGPERSARTTDPDLLGMFGQPLFAYSGSNPGVGFVLGATPWATDVSPRRVPGAYFREGNRPWANALMARPAVLRAGAGPAGVPPQLFDYHPAGTVPAGEPVERVTANPGMTVGFRWDPALHGWRREAWWRDHVHADGTPVAPVNVVVLDTPYRQSLVDDRSPEALSVGTGRAWVFTEGQLRRGTWTRVDRTDRWNLRDGNGASITLSPGPTWVVLAEGEPDIRLAG